MKSSLYQYAKDFVIENAGNGFTQHQLEKYLFPEDERNKSKSLKRIYQSILESAQNAQRSPNVIGKAISGEKGNIKPLGSFHCDFCPKQTALSYGHLEPKILLEKLYQRYMPSRTLTSEPYGFVIVKQ